jgi:2-oxoisovalerate dehydrogenase E1 component
MTVIRPSAYTSDEKLKHYKDLYKVMFTSREVDRLEDEYTGRGEAFFHVSGAGHEAVATLNHFLIKEDYLHCHYRDKALMLARGIPTEMFFHSLFAKDASHSKGRQMSAHLSDASRNVLSLVGPVGNNALQAAGVATELKHRDSEGIVLCAMGEGTTQEGEVLESIAEAVRWNLPVLFLVEDNKFAISTKTSGMTFFETPAGPVDTFYGIDIKRFSSVDVFAAEEAFAEAVEGIRAGKGPAIVLMQGERLTSHTNADDQKVYRDSDDIENAAKIGDPLVELRKWLSEQEVDDSELEEIESEVRTSVRKDAEFSRASADPVAEFTAKAPLPEKMLASDYENLGSTDGELTMIDAMREVLNHQLANDDRISLYGEDIEDPKGDVFGLTRGLSTAFPGRVVNSPLTESTIAGVAAGRALAGGVPVAFLQFADFLPIAFNQLISEIGSMHWRTDGTWKCPVIFMVTCGGYRPGLGPFHAQTLESIVAHTPGVDVYMPSTAYDAAGLLNSAFESGRPSVFFYPKSCLNDRSQTTTPDVEVQRAEIGKARFDRRGTDLTFVAYGNCVERCRKVAEILEPEGFTSDVIDLRSISPWDENAVIESAKKTGRLIVVHEDNISCGMGAEVAAVVAEKAPGVEVRRVARPDTYVPFHFGNQLDILPSVKRILDVTSELVGLKVEYQEEAKAEAGYAFVEAVGTSPSDESVTIVDWLIEEGDEIKDGQNLASYEADKAAADLLSPISGIVEEILVDEEEKVKVGENLLKVKIQGEAIAKPLTQEKLPPYEISKVAKAKNASDDSSSESVLKIEVGIESVETVLSSIKTDNVMVLEGIEEDKEPDDIVRGTGIENRYRINDKEDALSLGSAALQKALDNSGITLNEVGMLLVSTGTPGQITPSLACRILHEVGGDEFEIPAMDFSAACSGYVYGLQLAYDQLQQDASKKVILLTVEVLSPLLDEKDFGTAILFGDAATATILGANNLDNSIYKVERPILSAKGEPGKFLTVPTSKEVGVISMNGNRVFQEGVRKMSQVLKQTCRAYEIEPSELDMVVPHQANKRIMEAIRTRMGLNEENVYSNIASYGNTSSNTIPIALGEIFAKEELPQTMGITAFGGGFTYGAGILNKVKK